MDPKIYLAIDNCFASKRWARPAEWMRVIRGLGLRYVEASADTECDPLYMGEAFTKDWIDEVRREGERQDVVVKNLYSGHGTYATCGLSHYDARVRRRFCDQWMKAQMNTAQALGAGFGFFAHGFDETLLQDDALYEARLEELYALLAELAVHAREIGMNYVGIEQMYSPHQPPWRIADAARLMREVYARAGAPFYITADLGHMNGQQFFQRPDAEYICAQLARVRAGEKPRRLWFGTRHARELFHQACAGARDEASAVAEILADVEAHPNLFAKPEDGSIGAWVRAHGCYSPIIHLQQSDGVSSPHWTFTPENNARGVVRAEAFLRDLAAAYAQPEDPSMPPRCGEVVLTLEPFISTAGSAYDLLEELEESVAYWRGFIPRDGMRLSEIVTK